MYRIAIYDTESDDLICILHGTIEDIANLIELIPHNSKIRFRITSL